MYMYMHAGAYEPYGYLRLTHSAHGGPGAAVLPPAGGEAASASRWSDAAPRTQCTPHTVHLPFGALF